MRAEVQAHGDAFRVTTYADDYANGWGVGVDFPSEAAAETVADAIIAAVEGKPMRYALVRTEAGRGDTIAAYMPGNYAVLGRTPIGGSNMVRFLIGGRDSCGWTLDGYVIPRLASGMFFAEEVA